MVGHPPAGPAESVPDTRDADPPEADAPGQDDPVLDDTSGADLLSRELGASIIEVVDEP